MRSATSTSSMRGGGRNAAAALNSASGTIEFAVGKGTWPARRAGGLAGRIAAAARRERWRRPFNCLAGRFEVSGGVANLRRLVFDTPRATWIGGGYLSLRNEGWEFIVAPEARDSQGVPLATPLRLKGGTGRPAAGRARSRPQPAADRRGAPCRAWSAPSARSPGSRTSAMPAPSWRRGSTACGRACGRRCRTPNPERDRANPPRPGQPAGATASSGRLRGLFPCPASACKAFRQ